MSIRLSLLSWTAAGLAVLLVGFLYRAVGSCTHSSCQRGFRKQTHCLSSDFLTVVVQQTFTLGGLFALIMGVVVARDGGQVSVLGPHDGGQRMEVKLGLAVLTAFLQELVDGQGGLFDCSAALVAQSWIH